MDEQMLDARGYPRAGGNLPGSHRGRTPPNKGLDLGPTPPSVTDIIAACQACPDTPSGRRTVALIILLWRTGMRIGCEALRLMEHDLDPEEGLIHIRCGKGGKARTVPMDPWGWRQFQPWLIERRNYPVGPVFCVVEGPTAGKRAVNQHQVNRTFRMLERKVGMRQRFAPHQLRHKFYLENEDLPAHVMMKLLGHANLKVTTTYSLGMPRRKIYEGILTRAAPVMTVPGLLSVEPSARRHPVGVALV